MIPSLTVDLISKQVTAIRYNANSNQQQSVTSHEPETVAEHTLLVSTNNSPTCVPNDLRLLKLMRNQNHLKTDLNQNHNITLSRLL